MFRPRLRSIFAAGTIALAGFVAVLWWRSGSSVGPRPGVVPVWEFRDCVYVEFTSRVGGYVSSYHGYIRMGLWRYDWNVGDRGAPRVLGPKIVVEDPWHAIFLAMCILAPGPTPITSATPPIPDPHTWGVPGLAYAMIRPAESLPGQIAVSVSHGLLILLLLAPLVVPPLIRRARTWSRGRLGCCRHCGYDLTGNESGRCPECGALAAGFVCPSGGIR